MYSLRLINNGYADHAGSRSDFVVIGHPQYNLGKVGADMGYKEGWDTTGTPCLPKRSLPGDRMRRMGKGKYLESLRSTEHKPSYKERVLAKSQSDTKVGAIRSLYSTAFSPGDPQGSLDTFVDQLQASDRLPACIPHRTTSGYANHIRSQPVMKHYTSIQEDLVDLRMRLRLAPEATKAHLQADDAWRYYALHLKQANKNEGQLRRTKMNATATVKKAMSGA